MAKKIGLFILLGLCFIGCKGGAGIGDNTNNIPTGTNPTNNAALYGTGTKIAGLLLDAPISGMSYTSSSFSGKTTSTGGYVCKDGEVIEFKIGTFSMGSVMCSSVITPVELVTNGQKKYTDLSSLSSSESDKVNKMLVLLQMMDADDNPSNSVLTLSTGYGASLGTVAGLHSIFSIKDLLTDENGLFSSIKTEMSSDIVEQGWDVNYMSRHSFPSESTARSYFESSVSSLTSCTASDVSNAATVTGVGYGSTKKCTALSCQTGYVLNSQGLCDVAPTCANMKVTGVETFSGTYPNCVPATCSSHFALNSSGVCESTISNAYYCVSGTINQGYLTADGLSEFPGVATTTLQKNSLKYNFVNQANGTWASGRNYGQTTAMFILRNNGSSELRKKAAVNSQNIVVSIPVGHWGKDSTSYDFYISAVVFSNPAGLEGNPMNQRAFRFTLASVYTDFDTISSANSGAGTDISMVKEYNGFNTGTTLSNDASATLTWRVKKNCDLSAWTVNY
jgi:hypothetical protein